MNVEDRSTSPECARIERMIITVISARVVTGDVQAVVRVDSPPRANIHLRLKFPITWLTDIWSAARDEALRYLEIA